MKFQITTNTFDKTVPLKEASMLLTEFQKTINGQTGVTMKVLDDTTTLWGGSWVIDPSSSYNLSDLVRRSLEANKVSREEQEEFIAALRTHMITPQPEGVSPVEEKVEQEGVSPVEEEAEQEGVSPVEEEAEQEGVLPVEEEAEQEGVLPSEEEDEQQPTPQSQKQEKNKKTSEKAKKMDNDGSKKTYEAGKKVLYAVSGWKVLTITLLLPLVYFTALLVIFMQLKVDNLWMIGGILIASTLVLCWYIANLIKSAQRKVLEKEVTPEIFKYVVYQQLKEKEKLDKKLEVYRAIHGSPEALHLTAPENIQAVHNLVEDIAE